MNTDLLSKLPFDVNKLSKCKTHKEVFSLYPEFDLPEFREEIDIQIGKALALIVILYSKDTFVSAKFSSTKIDAATFLGYPSVSGVIQDKTVHEALMCNNKVFNDMVIRYCRMQYYSDFSELVIFNNAYYNQLTYLNDGKSENSEKTKDVIQNISTLKKQIQEIENRMLNENNNPDLKENLYEHVEYTSLGIRPEDIAEKMRNGEDPVNARPYGKDYKFAKFGTRDRMYVDSD